MLAAGVSSRLGSPKQLLTYKGKTLLKHAVDEATNSSTDFIVVVVGANAAACINEIDKAKATVVENKEWEIGMASSLTTGLKTILQQQPFINGVIFMVCDQPFISSVVLNELIKEHKQTGKPIVASNYGEAIGTPVFFQQSFFPALMQLKGDEGAKKIIQQHKDEVATISFPKGEIDIDRKEEYEKLVRTS